jgi:hypothetical protein
MSPQKLPLRRVHVGSWAVQLIGYMVLQGDPHGSCRLYSVIDFSGSAMQERCGEILTRRFHWPTLLTFRWQIRRKAEVHVGFVGVII